MLVPPSLRFAWSNQPVSPDPQRPGEPGKGTALGTLRLLVYREEAGVEG